MGTSVLFDEVSDTTVSVTGLLVELKNMKPSSLKMKVAGGTSGFVNAVWLMPVPLITTPAPVVLELVLPSETPPLRPMR